MIVGCALYDHRRRVACVACVATIESLRHLEEHPGAFAWIGLAMTSVDELSAVCEALGIGGEVDVEQLLAPHRQPVLSIEGSLVQLVLRTGRYVDSEEVISLGELAVIMSPRAVVSIRYGKASPLSKLRAELEADPELLAGGPAAVLVAIIEQVIADHGPALDGFEQDMNEVERDVFDERGPQPVRRVYRLNPLVMLVMLAIVAVLFRYFRRNGWL